MPQVDTVTVKIKKVTKAALDIYQATYYAQYGKTLTNDDAILRLLSEVDPAAVKAAQDAFARGGGDTEKSDD